MQEGERLTLEDLLYALILTSANDAAETIAIHFSGSLQEFAIKMNDKARSLGATGSNFVNPHGMPDPNHYSTAYDLSLITLYALKNPAFREIVRKTYKNITRPDADRSKGPPQEYLRNHNRFLDRYEGAIGVKTGYTVEAGQCLVAAAQRNDRELITVILNDLASTLYSDAQEILDYGFNNFQPQTVVLQGDKVSNVKISWSAKNVDVFAESSFHYDTPNGKPQTITRSIQLDRQVKAPLNPGQKVGQLVLSAGNQEVGRVNLITLQPVERFPGKRWLNVIACLFILFMPLGVRRTVRKRKRRLKRRKLKY